MKPRIKNIIIDAGHGGLKDGVYTTAPNKMFTFPDGKVVYEGVINRIFAEITGSILDCYDGIKIHYTVRPDDPEDMPLDDRVDFANEFDPEDTVFISIHANAGKGDGLEIFTSKGPTESDLLAECLFDAMEPYYEKADMKLRYDFTDKDRDKEADFYVLRKTKCPAVLIELGFFDNRDNVEMLEDGVFQTNVSNAIHEGILNFIYD